MPRHAESLALFQTMKNAISTLLGPLEEVEQAIDNDAELGIEPVCGRRTIQLDLSRIAHYVLNADADFSDDEAAFLDDSEEAFDPEWIELSDPSKLRDYLRKEYNRDPHRYAKPELPFSVSFLNLYDKAYDTNFSASAKDMFIMYANAVAQSDDKVTQAEECALSAFKKVLDEPLRVKRPDIVEKLRRTRKAQKDQTAKPENLDTLLDDLNSLIGLDAVKANVAHLVNFLKVQQIRKSNGLESQPISRHLVFYGSPGTGKTSVARLLAKIYSELGILSKGHLIETDRSGLVAGYVGQTALKVKDVAGSALGGILFIDEAYALSAGGGQDFGQEAIDTLLKIMEDNRDDLIVVVAGYTEKINAFLSSNPGLRSRFNKYLFFEDYTPTQLVEIFDSFCNKAGYQICQPTRESLQKLFSILYGARDEAFGNARLVRNLFEMTIANQANRIVSLADISGETLSTITQDDIPTLSELRTIWSDVLK